MTDAHCHVSAGDPAIREFLVGRDFFGIHPWDAAVVGDVHAAIAGLRERLIASPRAGVGEIGLDRLREREIPPAMHELFLAQLRLARELSRPVVLHGAKCWGRVVKAVAEVGETRYAFLCHGFSRSDGLIPEIVRLNGYISVGPAVLNDHAVNYREMVRRIPLDRLLVETDRDAPPDGADVSVRAVLAKTAELLGVPAEELEARTDENAARFVSLPDML